MRGSICHIFELIGLKPAQCLTFFAVGLLVMFTSDARANAQLQELAQPVVSCEQAMQGADAALELNSAQFQNQFRSSTNSALRRGVSAMLLAKGNRSFVPVRPIENYIDDAQSEITLTALGLLEGAKGEELAQKLIEKSIKREATDDVPAQNVKVRVMVDAQTAARPNYNKALSMLANSGVEVIYWQQTGALGDEYRQYRDMLIIDGQSLFLGGLNSDFFIAGAVATDAHNIFARLWNRQVSLHNLKYKKMEYTRALWSDRPGEEIIALIDHSPDKVLNDNLADNNIIRGATLALRSAKTSIDIQNADWLLTPNMEKEISDAISRGVQVRVLSNADKNLDNPHYSRATLQSLQRLIALGAEVYLRKGTTVQSGFVVDGRFAMVGGNNFYPSGLRLEGEVMVAVFGGDTVSAIVKIFNHDISSAESHRVVRTEDIVLPAPFEVIDN